MLGFERPSTRERRIVDFARPLRLPRTPLDDQVLGLLGAGVDEAVAVDARAAELCVAAGAAERDLGARRGRVAPACERA